VLLFGWGAAAEQVLKELSSIGTEQVGGSLPSSAVFCISQTSQAKDCDLRDVCAALGFKCVLSDNEVEILEMVRGFRPDLIVSASYRKKLPGSVLNLCPDCINFHPSLLPKHRGCWSGFWCIFEGDTETGVTCHRMVEAFDAGLVLHQERIVVDEVDTAFSVYRKLLPVTARCARQVFLRYFSSEGLPAGEEQKGESSYHYRKLPFNGLVQPDWSDQQVARFIRAMEFPPFDGAAVLVDGKRLLVDSVEEISDGLSQLRKVRELVLTLGCCQHDTALPTCSMNLRGRDYDSLGDAIPDQEAPIPRLRQAGKSWGHLTDPGSAMLPRRESSDDWAMMPSRLPQSLGYQDVNLGVVQQVYPRSFTLSSGYEVDPTLRFGGCRDGELSPIRASTVVRSASPLTTVYSLPAQVYTRQPSPVTSVSNGLSATRPAYIGPVEATSSYTQAQVAAPKSFSQGKYVSWSPGSGSATWANYSSTDRAGECGRSEGALSSARATAGKHESIDHQGVPQKSSLPSVDSLASAPRPLPLSLGQPPATIQAE
ncbi:arnA, partial [Symbiodinium sp. CCMP2456]